MRRPGVWSRASPTRWTPGRGASCFTPAGLAWLQAFKDAVAQAEAEFRAEVGNEVATVVMIGLEAYAAPFSP
jgi:hypothetical protein